MIPDGARRLLDTLAGDSVPDNLNLLPRITGQIEAERKHAQRQSRRRLALALLVLLALAAALLSLPGVASAMKRLFGYIPGFGVVENNTPVRVLAEPVSLTRDGVTVSVTKAILTNDKTQIIFGAIDVPSSAYSGHEDVPGCITPAYLRLPDGTRLDIVQNVPIPASVDAAILVIPCISNTLPGTVPENWELPLRFIPAPPGLTVVPVIESLPTATATMLPNTPTAEVNPLAITKVLDVGDKFVLMGEFNYDAAKDASGPAGSWWALERVDITGADGQEVPRSFSNDFELPTPTRPDSETWVYQLAKNFIPPMTVTYQGEAISPVGAKEQAEFEFDAGLHPQAGKTWAVDKDFKLGGYRIRLVSISSGENGYSFQFKADPGASANLISVDIAGYTPNCGGGGGGDDQFPEEFSRQVCYAGFQGSPAFPEGKLTTVINFQALVRKNKPFHLQWSPDTSQAGPFATSTAQPGVCITHDSVAGLGPPPAEPAGKVLFSMPPKDGQDWRLTLANLDGSPAQAAVPQSNDGAFAPDGEQLAYAQADGIHLIDLASGATTLLKGSPGGMLKWSPDGRQLAYLGFGAEPGLYVTGVDGSGLRQLAKTGGETLAGWSADGKDVYLTVLGPDGWRLRAVDSSSGARRDLFTLEDASYKTSYATVSPDGRWIAYRQRENDSVILMSLDGSQKRLLMDKPASAVVGIAWSVDGKWLGVSLAGRDSNDYAIVMVQPEGCRGYRLPEVSGVIEGLLVK